MTIHLSSQLEQFVREMVDRGAFRSPSEVVEHALRLLEQRDAGREQKLEVLRKEIAAGIEQADRGELLDGEEAFDELEQRIGGESNSD